MRVHILTIGDEILIGQIIDTNSAWMGQQLNLMGAEIEKIVSVGDDYSDIIENLTLSHAAADVILVTGGLGPTKDDITKKAIADFLGVELEFHQPSWDRIQRFFERLGRTTTPAHKEQCYMPAGAEILRNKMGTAPGMLFRYQNTIIVSMPGVPYEMKYLMEHEVLPKLKQTFPGRPIAHRTILTVGEGESRIAQRLEALEESFPEHIKLAYLPNLGRVRLRLTGRGGQQTDLEKELDHYAAEVEALLPDLIYGREKDELEAVIGQMLIERNLTLGTAESCTGGLLSATITHKAGASKIFDRGFITYSNDAKTDLLGVKPDTLDHFGAVSEQTADEMAQGALQNAKAHLAVSITGIAGPDGGTAEKPVGLVYFGFALKEGSAGAIKMKFEGNRKEIQAKASAAALKNLISILEDEI